MKFARKLIAALRIARIAMPCIWKAITVWGFRPTEPGDMEKFLEAHYPLEMRQIERIREAVKV